MSTSKDLLLAILAMDSYNQGYGKGIDHGKTQIGVANFDDDKGDAEAVAADFYAVSYTLTSGETVISYRGTDFTPDQGMANDIADGWATGGGDFRASQLEENPSR